MTPARLFLMGVSSGALLAAWTPALAQSAAAPDAAAQAGQQNQVAEVVVTAQKRAQNIQDVPVAVTAVTRDTLQANRVVSVMDLTGLAPGLFARMNAGSLESPSYSLRGVFASASVPGQDREISTYLDGVYIGGTRGAVFDLPDIADVEVLRGPQGTLFGRNATAGAISINTRDPTGNFHIHQDLTGGNEGQFRSRTSVDFPAWGPFSAYFTFVHDQLDGDIRNLGAGSSFDFATPFYPGIGVSSSPKWLGGHNTNNVFFALKFAPTDNFSMVNKFDWSSGSFTPEARGSTAINPNNLVGATLLGVLAAQPPGGGAFGPVVFAPSSGQRPNAINNAFSQPGTQTAWGDSLTAVWHPVDNVTVKNVAAYRYSTIWTATAIMGLDGLQFTQGAVPTVAYFDTVSHLGAAFFGLTPMQQAAALAGTAAFLQPQVGEYFAGYESNNYAKYYQDSDELQVNYQSKWLTLTAGGLYFHSNELGSGLPGYSGNFGFSPTPFELPLGNIEDEIANETSVAGYIQGEIHATSQFDIVLGGRMTRDSKNGSLDLGGTFVGNKHGTGSIVGATLIPWAFANTKPTYSIGLNYKLTHDILLYAKYSTAFLSGGAVGVYPFAPETVGSWEGGIKSEWFDRRLRANLAVWDAVYHNQQAAQSGQNVTPPAPTSVVVIDDNTLRAHGFELEVSAVPLEGLTLNGSLSYTHGYLQDPNPEVATSAVTGKVDPFLWAADPPWMGDVSAEYRTHPLFGDAYGTVRLEAQYTGRYRAEADPLTAVEAPVFAPYQFVPVTWLLNGRLALHDVKLSSGTVEVAVWVKNMLNNGNPTYPLLFGAIEFDDSWQPARTFGLDVSYDF